MNHDNIEIYWHDLVQTKQDEILKVLGDNGNWDVFPIAILGVMSENYNTSQDNYAEV